MTTRTKVATVATSPPNGVVFYSWEFVAENFQHMLLLLLVYEFSVLCDGGTAHATFPTF